MAKSSLEKMKDRLKKSSPKISGRMNLENMNQIKNFMFGKKKGMGVDDDVKGISIQKAKKKIADSKNKKSTTKKDTRLSPGALGGKIKPAVKKDTRLSPGALGGKITSTVKKDKKKIVKPITKTDSKSKVKATAANTKDFAKTMAMQKKLIAKGAKIKADGIMGAKTRAAMAKFMSKPPMPKARPTKNSDVSQGSTIAKDRGKTGFGTSAMNTKGSTKPAEKRAKKFGITKLTELQKKRARRDNRRKMIGST